MTITAIAPVTATLYRETVIVDMSIDLMAAGYTPDVAAPDFWYFQQSARAQYVARNGQNLTATAEEVAEAIIKATAALNGN